LSARKNPVIYSVQGSIFRFFNVSLSGERKEKIALPSEYQLKASDVRGFMQATTNHDKAYNQLYTEFPELICPLIKEGHQN